MTEFDSYSDDDVSAVIGVQHREVPNRIMLGYGLVANG